MTMEPSLGNHRTDWSLEEALHESELRFRSVVESANDAVLLMDSTSRILSMNPATKRIFGYGDELLTHRFFTLLPEQHQESYRNALKELTPEGDFTPSGKTLELIGLRKDGTEFPIELTLAQWRLGSRLFFCGTVHDISRRRHAESALIKKTALVQLLQEVAVASNEATNIEDAV